MHTFYLILGITILVVIAYDFFYTTLSFNGAGYLSRLTSRFLSALFLFLNRYIPRRNALRYSGVTHILFLLGMWIGLLWIGFFLLLVSDPRSVVEAGTGSAASVLTKLYVSGYTLSTLGVGDYIPGSEGWQIIMAAFSFAGFIFITTAMTYLMSLTTAVIHKRNLSLFIANMGDTPEEILINLYSCEEEHFIMLPDFSIKLREMINKHNQNHYAHPAVHYFYST
ncbi:MAG: ion channel, partial [Hyphomicrobiales bacterium]